MFGMGPPYINFRGEGIYLGREKLPDDATVQDALDMARPGETITILEDPEGDDDDS